eukprot:2410099-Rhodomonas_salina.2
MALSAYALGMRTDPAYCAACLLRRYGVACTCYTVCGTTIAYGFLCRPQMRGADIAYGATRLEGPGAGCV